MILIIIEKNNEWTGVNQSCSVNNLFIDFLWKPKYC